VRFETGCGKGRRGGDEERRIRPGGELWEVGMSIIVAAGRGLEDIAGCGRPQHVGCGEKARQGPAIYGYPVIVGSQDITVPNESLSPNFEIATM